MSTKFLCRHAKVLPEDVGPAFANHTHLVQVLRRQSSFQDSDPTRQSSVIPHTRPQTHLFRHGWNRYSKTWAPIEMATRRVGFPVGAESTARCKWPSNSTRLKVLLDLRIIQRFADNCVRTMGSLAIPTLYSHLGTWLRNDAEQWARYMSFNVISLQEIACKSVDARNYTEGSYNNNILLGGDNSSLAIARIPSSVIGNAYFSRPTESLLCISFARGSITIIPQNPHQRRTNRLCHVGLQYLFAQQIGSLYFKEDVSTELQNRPLYLGDEENQLPNARNAELGP
ncbi:hypothetical protein ARMGADRAFT_1057114 [Armillaria gallica]|uniref:Uncharacterized protein n=1 Tax=Armillaria gallica TaxID=47427 RepID=A0A2H3EDJ6_ARMGA|nr:hypothetical protein ARMGADRAFT_1057114 [Armillaria gallica]